MTSLRVLHQLLSAGSIITIYSDAEHIRDFVSEAERAIPGVEAAALCMEGSPGVAGIPGIASICKACPNSFSGAFGRDDTTCLLEERDDFACIPLKTLQRLYGFNVLKLDNRAIFNVYEDSFYNFSNTVAMCLENIEYRNNLEEQVTLRTRELERSKAYFQSLFEQIGDSLLLIDKDYTVERLNKAALDLVLPERLPAEGKKCHYLIHGKTDPCPWCPARAVFDTGVPGTSVVPYPDENDPVSWWNVSSFPVYDEKGRIVKILEAGRDITEIQALQHELELQVGTKELLLKEIHHRVKNSLNTVYSLLKVQLGTFSDENLQRALQVSLDRVRSIADIHRYLYQSDSHENVDFRAFVSEFIVYITQTYSSDGNIQIRHDIADVPLHIDISIPVSLIINELVTNALKYAFPAGRTGTVNIWIASLPDGEIELTVRDDGVGLPDLFDPEKSDTLGYRIVSGLVSQIGGSLDVASDEGTCVTIQFKNPEKTSRT